MHLDALPKEGGSEVGNVVMCKPSTDLAGLARHPTSCSMLDDVPAYACVWLCACAQVYLYKNASVSIQVFVLAFDICVKACTGVFGTLSCVCVCVCVCVRVYCLWVLFVSTS